MLFSHAVYVRPRYMIGQDLTHWVYHAIGGLVIYLFCRGACYRDSKRERDVTHCEDLGTARRRVVCCLISNVIVLCLECQNGRDHAERTKGVIMLKGSCMAETKCSARITLAGRVLTSNPTLWTFLPALRKEDNLIDLLAFLRRLRLDEFCEGAVVN